MQRVLAAAVIVVAGLIAYANSFTGVFLFDDGPSIIDNPYAHNPEPWKHPLRAMQAPRNVTVSGRPVASFSFALNYALAPIDARNTFDPPSPGSLAPSDRYQQNLWGYHATNLAIHLLAALTLFGIVRRTLQTRALRDFTAANATPLALLIALAWTVHPVNTGSVTYIVQRVESLMGLFMLLTLYCAIRAADALSGAPELKRGPTYDARLADDARAKQKGTYVGPSFSSGAPQGSLMWSLASVATCLLGMGTKETMVGAPILVMLWDWTFLPGTCREILKKRAPLYGGLAATWLLLVLLVAMNARPLSSGFGFPEWPWWRYLATQTAVIAHYLRLAFVPSPLVLDYDWPAVKSVATVLGPSILIVTLALLTIWQLARRRPLGFAGAWFFIILSPSSSVFPIVSEIAAEHRMYLPLAAVIAVAVLASYAALQRLNTSQLTRRIAFAAALLVVGAMTTATRARNDDYTSDEHMWADTVQKQPLNARARNNYGTDLLQSGQAKAAAEQFLVAVTQTPTYAQAHANLGLALVRQQQIPEALQHFERAVELNPFYTAVFEPMADAYSANDQPAKAVKYLLKTLDQKPGDVELLNKTAWILATSRSDAARDGAQAMVLAQHAVDVTARRDASSLDSLAAAFAESGRFDDAVTAVEQALSIARARGDRQFNLELEQRLALYRAKRPFRQ